MIYQNLRNAILESLKVNNWDPKDIPFFIQKVQKKEYGELFTNVALIISNKYNLDLDLVTKKIINCIDKNKYHFKKINVLNGYLNFFHELKYLNNVINIILENSNNFGSSDIGKNQKVNYEWVSANPTGYLHVGHARNVIVGDCITKILEFAGYKVYREFYINDAGLQVYKSAMSVYFHYSKLIKQDFNSFDGMYKNPEVKDAANYIYKKYSNLYKNLKFLKNNLTDKEIEFSRHVKNFFLYSMKKDCEIFGIHFDIWFSEESLYENNQFELFKKKFEDKKISYKKDGAIWLNAKKYGSPDDFVLQKSDGSTTYFSGDIMYHDNKYRRGYDLMINLWGSDHHGHFIRVKSGIKALGWDETKFDVNFIQMVRLIDSKGKLLKLSKRAGNTIFLRDIVKEYGTNFIRFMIISRKRTTDFKIDFSLLKEKNIKNPLYYVQYAYARAYQLVKKLDKNYFCKDYLNLISDSEKDLILSFYQLKKTIEMSAKKQEPQLIVEFLIQLSKKFHTFYQNNRIIGVDENLLKERINLVKAFLQVMKNAFNLIGIEPVKEM